MSNFLQHLGTIILLTILFLDIRTNRLTTLAFAFFALFIFIHIIGARYIYSYVPYDKWINGLLDFIKIHSKLYVSGRNGYDRFVHFAFGILVFPLIYEYLDNHNTLSKVRIIIFTWAIIQTISMIYELFEWGLTLVLSTEAANDYNGQQGDLWDAQKDMFLALLGSTLIALIYLISKKREH